uniref:Uridylate-specific endoribonuclease n=1 Tax=Oncorhynchus mykiss TaxID=8022 RepID=A0A8K9UD66_ONCMY
PGVGRCLVQLSVIVQEIWDKDVNRLKPGTDYRISLGKPGLNADMNDDSDGAGYPLFSFVDESIFKKESFFAFISLLDNYESDTGEPETVTLDEEAENHKFLDCMLRMPTLKLSIAHKYLVEKQLSPEGLLEFKEQLYRIWFVLYARRGTSRPDSSGFEHVFVGETRGGFHNWIQLYMQKGYKNTFNLKPDKNKHILALQFSWKNGIKSKGSIFVGVSPEFEFAHLYPVDVICHHYNKKHIGTTYPVLVKYQNKDKNKKHSNTLSSKCQEYCFCIFHLNKDTINL